MISYPDDEDEAKAKKDINYVAFFVLILAVLSVAISVNLFKVIGKIYQKSEEGYIQFYLQGELESNFLNLFIFVNFPICFGNSK